ncbi:hypothetical protein OG552_17320 [Streptomyces sp. NBC_01476]|uniref:hypothetical protein n=1 Tax=Streptomyces sp. NBC_01476 TaxID=2903881 RepID=UPI002E30F645|nr:hypothetical protein [Streptomyces sp. NBC_01476]
MTTASIPMAARAAAVPPLVQTTARGVTWDDDRQLNVGPDGSPWHTAPQAASCTDTNQDGQGDDVDDPYYAPGA